MLPMVRPPDALSSVCERAVPVRVFAADSASKNVVGMVTRRGGAGRGGTGLGAGAAVGVGVTPGPAGGAGGAAPRPRAPGAWVGGSRDGPMVEVRVTSGGSGGVSGRTTARSRVEP